MKSRQIKFRDRITQSRAYFTVFKLPVILFTAIFGLILEFVIELPFMVLCMLDHRRGRTEPEMTDDRATEPDGLSGRNHPDKPQCCNAGEALTETSSSELTAHSQKASC